MDIGNVFEKCNNNFTSQYSYNPSILADISYIDNNDDDECIDIETLYNRAVAKSGKNKSFGSSMGYNIPPFIDTLDDDPIMKKSRIENFGGYYVYRPMPVFYEHYGAFDYLIVILCCIVLIFVIISLMKKSCWRCWN